MKPIVVFFVGVLLMSQAALAQKESSVASGTVTTKALMQQFLGELLALRKYMVSEKRFVDPKNMPQISEHLKEMVRLSQEASHDPMLNVENFKMSREVLTSHLAETQRVYNSGNKTFARWMLNSAVYVCMSCHTQLPAMDIALLQKKDSDYYFSEFEQAEFLFAARSFKEALRLYEFVIDKGSDENFEVERSLERVVIYYSRIQRDPKAAIKKLEKYRLIKRMPQGLRTQLADWIAQFKVFDKMDFKNVQRWSAEEVLQFAQKHLEGKNQPFNLVTYSWVSGILFEYLKNHDESAATPDILYWLAVSDNQMSNNVFFSLAHMYLRECIVKYPKTAAAKKCYQEYEEEITVSYSGTRGTEIPRDVREDLKKLKKQAFGK